MGVFDKPTGKRWPRAQRFTLSARGGEAEASYREVIVAARAEPGRGSFDAAREAWAARHALQPGDGLFLGELRAGPRTLEEILRAVEDCGADKEEVHQAVDRLTDAGLVEAVAPPEPPPPPPRRW